MIEYIAATGYLLTSLFFLILVFLLVINWQKKLQGLLLILASAISVVWAAVIAYQLVFGTLASGLIWLLETLRTAGWLLFLGYLLWEMPTASGLKRSWLVVLLSLAGLLVVVQLLPHEYLLGDLLQVHAAWVNDLRIIFYLALAVIGISLLEQFFRNTTPDSRWTIKYLSLGLGLVFFYDFFLYADALLFTRIDPIIWESRGAVNALVAPLVAVSARRNPDWSLKVFVSKQVVFHTTGILGAGIYLLSMSLLGYYIKDYGGEYGDFFRMVFLVIAVVLLFILVSSGQLRARLKVFLNKHFFKYQYDYREEWLKLINLLSSANDPNPMSTRVITVMSGIIDSHQANLWVCRQDSCRCVAGQDKLDFKMAPQLWRNTIAFLNDSQWIIDIDEYKANPTRYENLQLPEAVLTHHDAWLIVPLLHENHVHSFVVLSHSNSISELNWENRDLLKMAGRQAASYLVLEEAAKALAEAQQFEGFNRLSAFVIHDLKNLIAQLSLVTSNAARHKHNPAFIDDVIVTIENSVSKMNRLMAQLKSAGMSEKRKAVDLVAIVEDVIAEKQRQRPQPELRNLLNETPLIEAEAERLSAVIGHIIQNAQDATADNGSIHVTLEKSAQEIRLTVTDTGSGMDGDFIQNRLFKPFDTTKGLTGMGIGAYECREFMQSMNGDIEVNSQPGRGTDFTLCIPIAVAEDDKGD